MKGYNLSLFITTTTSVIYKVLYKLILGAQSKLTNQNNKKKYIKLFKKLLYKIKTTMNLV